MASSQAGGGDVMGDDDDDDDMFMAMDPFAIGNAVRQMMRNADVTEAPVGATLLVRPYNLL